MNPLQEIAIAWTLHRLKTTLTYLLLLETRDA